MRVGALLLDSSPGLAARIEHLTKSAEHLSDHVDWLEADLSGLASNTGLKEVFTLFRRMASAITHAEDVEGYNPFLIEYFRHNFSFGEPYFLTGYGFWSVGDALALASLLEIVPVCIFGETAGFLSIAVPEDYQDLIQAAGTVLYDNHLPGHTVED
jgi:hypothetical protein